MATLYWMIDLELVELDDELVDLFGVGVLQLKDQLLKLVDPMGLAFILLKLCTGLLEINFLAIELLL